MNQIQQVLINITLVVIIPLTIAILFIKLTKNRNIGFALLFIIVPISNKIRTYIEAGKAYFYRLFNWIKVRFLSLIMILLALGALVLWRSGTTPGTLSDFGLNAFTELLGIVVTVAIVDILIKKQNDNMMLPVKAAMYRDIQLFLIGLVNFWCNVHRLSVPEGEPKSIQELFSEDCFKKMTNLLFLDSQSHVDKQTWWQSFVNQANDSTQRGKEILERYTNMLEPEVFKQIHRLVEDGLFIKGMKIIVEIRNLDIAEKIPRPRFLGAYFPDPVTEDFKAVIGLFKWCQENYLKLSGKGFKVYQVTVGYSNQPKETFPPSMITLEQIKLQNDAFKTWQQGPH